MFGKKKKDKFVDLSGRLERHRERIRDSPPRQRVRPDSSGTLDLSSSSNSYGMSSGSNESSVSSSAQSPDNSSSENTGGGFFGNFFGGSGNSASAPTSTETSDAEERRKKLAKRIQGMTNKIEELENELFRMKQRVDVLEKKQRLDY